MAKKFEVDDYVKIVCPKSSFDGQIGQIVNIDPKHYDKDYNTYKLYFVRHWLSVDGIEVPIDAPYKSKEMRHTTNPNLYSSIRVKELQKD